MQNIPYIQYSHMIKAIIKDDVKLRQKLSASTESQRRLNCMNQQPLLRIYTKFDLLLITICPTYICWFREVLIICKPNIGHNCLELVFVNIERCFSRIDYYKILFIKTLMSYINKKLFIVQIHKRIIQNGYKFCKYIQKTKRHKRRGNEVTDVYTFIVYYK